MAVASRPDPADDVPDRWSGIERGDVLMGLPGMVRSAFAPVAAVITDGAIAARTSSIVESHGFRSEQHS